MRRGASRLDSIRQACADSLSEGGGGDRFPAPDVHYLLTLIDRLAGPTDRLNAVVATQVVEQLRLALRDLDARDDGGDVTLVECARGHVRGALSAIGDRP